MEWDAGNYNGPFPHPEEWEGIVDPAIDRIAYDNCLGMPEGVSCTGSGEQDKRRVTNFVTFCRTLYRDVRRQQAEGEAWTFPHEGRTRLAATYLCYNNEQISLFFDDEWKVSLRASVNEIEGRREGREDLISNIKI